ncbi:MAG TPA: hypothetical protein VIR16_06205, partial [Candidatus Limnocylindrales bacterium]
VDAGPVRRSARSGSQAGPPFGRSGMGLLWAALAAVAAISAACAPVPGTAAPSGSSPVVAVATASFPSVAPTAPGLNFSPSSAPSLAPSSSPSASPAAVSPTVAAASPAASPEFPHADADLERYVPARIGGVELSRISIAASALPPAGGDMCILLCGNEPREFAQALGIPLDRVTVAISFGDRGGIGGIAFRATGVATDRLAAAGSAIKGGVVGGGWAFPMAKNVAGRSVWYLDRLNRGQYLVPIGDVLVFVYGEAPMTAPGRISNEGTVPPAVVAFIEALPR